MPTKNRRERRATRLREPDLHPDTTVYRSDGACRGQGRIGILLAGWGAAVWAETPDGRAVGAPLASSNGTMHAGATNNTAEYRGLLERMERAVRSNDLRVVFQVDSMLLAMQMATLRPWGLQI